MRLNIYEALMQKAYLFGAPVLHSGEPIPQEDVPLGWYCYDLRGTSRAPHSPYSMVDHADKYHTGSVLSLLPLKSERTQSRLVKDQFRLTQEFVSLKTFCAENNITAPEIPFRHQMRPATPEEAGLFIMKTSSQEGTAKQPAPKGRQGMKHMSGGKPPCIWLPAKSLETF